MKNTQAVILEVLECWPPELLLDIEGQKRTFVLREDAQVIQGTEQVSLNRLLPDARIQLN